LSSEICFSWSQWENSLTFRGSWDNWCFMPNFWKTRISSSLIFRCWFFWMVLSLENFLFNFATTGWSRLSSTKASKLNSYDPFIFWVEFWPTIEKGFISSKSSSVNRYTSERVSWLSSVVDLKGRSLTFSSKYYCFYFLVNYNEQQSSKTKQIKWTFWFWLIVF
jgi:hypothetical protein